MRDDAADKSSIFSAHRIWPRRDNADEDLIAKIVAGNRLAMQVLYARHHTRIYRLLLRLTGDADIAEVLLAEVFLSAWRHAHRFDGSSTVSTWLIAIASRKADTELQRRSVTQCDSQDLTIGDATAKRTLALRSAPRAEKVRTCLARLPREHREIIDLVYYHEKTVAEAARIVGIPEGTVKTRMMRARHRMSELLKDAGIDGLQVC